MSTQDQSQAWVQTIEEDKGYSAPDPGVFRALLRRMPRYAFFDAVLRHLPRSVTVLEAGCGWAMSSFALAERGNTVTAIDISEKLIRDLQILQRQLGGQYIQNLTLDAYDIFRLQETGWSFDAVISDGTYEHFLQETERASFIRNIRAVLKPGGFFIVAVPNLHNPLFASVVDPKMPAMHPFTLMSLKEELIRSGFDVLETGYSFVNPGFAQWVQSRWMIAGVRVADAIFGFLPRPLRRIFSAHLYCVARLP